MHTTAMHRISAAPMIMNTTCTGTGTWYGGGAAGGCMGGGGLGGRVGEGGGKGGSVLECHGHHVASFSACSAPSKPSGM